jgi:ABC-type nitrate/sulfonate/bicarbonate transport system permease component
VALTHAMFNRSNNSDGIGADLLPGSDSRQLAALLATILLAAVLGLVLRGRLSRSYRRQLDEAEQRLTDPSDDPARPRGAA